MNRQIKSWPENGPANRTTDLRRANRTLHDLAVRARRARTRRGWSQQQTAQLLGIGIVTYRKMEQGDPGTAIGTWMALLELFGTLGEMNDVLLYDRDHLGAVLEQNRRQRRKSSEAVESLAERL